MRVLGVAGSGCQASEVSSMWVAHMAWCRACLMLEKPHQPRWIPSRSSNPWHRNHGIDPVDCALARAGMAKVSLSESQCTDSQVHGEGCPRLLAPPRPHHHHTTTPAWTRTVSLTRAQPQCCRLLLLRLLPPGSAPTHPPTARHRPQCRSSLGPLGGPPLLKPSPRDHQLEVPSDQRCMCDSEPSWPAQSSALCHRAVRAHNALESNLRIEPPKRHSTPLRAAGSYPEHTMRAAFVTAACSGGLELALAGSEPDY